jgi:type IV pilus assembly protein PilV
MIKCNSQNGFTLIEVLIAIALLTIGILGAAAMQISSLRGNSHANRITVASNWGVNRIEQIIAQKYDDVDLRDDDSIGNTANNPDGAGGLNDMTDATADGREISPDGLYTIYWNVAEDDIMPNTKSIRVIILRTQGGQTTTVTMNYVKAKYF